MDDPKHRESSDTAVARLHSDMGGWHPVQSPLVRDPNIHGGEPVFRGTRMPARILLDYLGGGYDLDKFLADFPGIERDEARAVLDMLRDALPALTPDAR